MNQLLHRIIRQHCRPLQPIPTGVPPRLRALEGIRAVLFDVYGTLLISASGDVEAADPDQRGRALQAALTAVGVTDAVDVSAGLFYWTDEIERDHQRGRAEGVPYPEVDVRDLWRRVLARLQSDGASIDVESVDYEELAAQYEVLVNPVWPMPQLRETLDRLASAGLQLGLISNAQFLTPELFPALLDLSLEELGFASDLCFYSFEQRRAKPDLSMYERAAEALAARGLAPAQAAYLGNDVLKDIMPARRVGFRTALFAGDARSWRPRREDARLAGIEPDIIVNTLDQLTACITSSF